MPKKKLSMTEMEKLIRMTHILTRLCNGQVNKRA